MRFNEAVCNNQLMTSMQIALQNNNQLQRSSSEVALNDKEPLTAEREFRIGQDTSTYSSLAVTRNSKIAERNNINNNLDCAFQSSSTESLADYERYYEDPSQELTGSDWSECSEEGNLPAGCRGIVNPNYPGFQHLEPSLLSDTDDTEDERELQDEGSEELARADQFNNNNNNGAADSEAVNRLDAQCDQQKQLFYEKPKFNIQSVSSLIECMNYVKSVQDISLTGDTFDAEVEVVQLTTSVKESLQFPEIEDIPDSSKCSEAEEIEETTLEEPIDLIREANALKSPSHQTNNNNINNNNNSNNHLAKKIFNPIASVEKSNKIKAETPGKLDEIDLLANINRRGESGCREQYQPQSSVPDVVAMDQDVVEQRRVADTNKMFNNELPEQPQQQHPQQQHPQQQHPQQQHPQQHPQQQQQQQQQQQFRNNGDVKKKEKMLRNQARRRQQSMVSQRTRRAEMESGSFDVYNIETAMPKIDMDAIETHLKAAREEERRRRNDREEIRRRLAMGPDADDMRTERGRKPSLQSRLQSGMNLQICFMNENSSDTESGPGLEGRGGSVVSILSPGSPTSSSSSSSAASSSAASPAKMMQQNYRPQLLSLPPLRLEAGFNEAPLDEADFFARQARLQTEARLALAQAKEMAHMQMEVERQKLKQNPITEMVRASLQKIGVTLGEDRRRLTRALLTELNIAQLQVLANDLHARIATLNEALVEGLLRRDDLHMEQDSMLVDVEDLTRYLGAKQESFKKRQLSASQGRCRTNQQQQQAQAQQQQQQRNSRARTLALISRASTTRLAAGRQLVVNLVRK